MTRFPADAPRERVLQALQHLGFHVVRQGNHIALLQEKSDGTRIPLTMPNHRRIKRSTLRTILMQAGIRRDEFMRVYYEHPL